MLNSNQIAEVVAILGLSCASVVAPVSGLLRQMESEEAPQALDSVPLFRAEPAGRVDLRRRDIEAELEGMRLTAGPQLKLTTEAVNQAEYDHPLTDDHPEHTEWCAASAILREIEAEKTAP
jgi:hypothetical protein